jgi:hypothetical protein
MCTSLHSMAASKLNSGKHSTMEIHYVTIYNYILHLSYNMPNSIYPKITNPDQHLKNDLAPLQLVPLPLPKCSILPTPRLQPVQHIARGGNLFRLNALVP